MICDTWFNIQRQFDETINLSFDYLATLWATSPKIGQFFFQISGHSDQEVFWAQNGPIFNLNPTQCHSKLILN
jgi:hypothetical protein